MIPSHQHSERRQARTPEPTTGTPFGDLSGSAVKDMEAISFFFQYPDAATLFREGELTRGIFILRSGRVKMYLSSGDGRTFILRMARAGDVLGLPSVLSGRPYEVTAETQGPCQVAFIKRDAFLHFMRHHKEVGIGAAQQLTRIYSSACHEVRCLGLSHTAGERLANLLLQWPLSNGDTASRIKFALRHEEVAQMIGSSRETVSRLFVEFKKRKLAELDGSTLYIRDRQLLQLIADGKTMVAPSSRRAASVQPPARSRNKDAYGEDSDSHFYADGV